MFSTIVIAIFIFTVCMSLIFLFQPSLIYDVGGNLKSFNINDSMITIEIVIPFIAILSYFTALIFSI
jgi:hypothetical protein